LIFLKNKKKHNHGAGSSTSERIEFITPIARKSTLEKLEGKQCSRQRLTLVKRQTLLAYEVKK
jgi:hypothetical protein